MRMRCIFVVLTLAAVPAAALEVERGPGGEPVIVQEGEASFYGDRFHGRTTASGETFDKTQPTAASPRLPFGTRATVTHQETGESVDVIVNDRGPFARNRVIDLSEHAAEQLDMIDDGTAPVRIEVRPSDQPTDRARTRVEETIETLSAE
ncbi:septal ring lytic transglycosylase RlpA family protein [Azospirillum halopraeferens]|uniref:septal ring lytic transglycosylase RlpA family protein n=1 Tax=Azospirillum halopraeferens TaxID=34010 RepID=UPI0004133785|nr:septal ring lytic transglycosylase RlpA family protein [Azospirillum halopraeferens]